MSWLLCTYLYCIVLYVHTSYIQVLEIFRAKAEKIGRRSEWREIMYAKLRDKYARDPRD